MNVLVLIWWATVVMAVAALLAMTGLICQRASRNLRRRRDAARRAQLREFSLRLVENPALLLQRQSELRRSDRRLLLQVYDELLAKIRGEYAERLVSLMRILGLMEECFSRLRNTDWFERAQACRTLGWFRDPNVILALYRAVDDPVPAVRVEAARSLSRIGAIKSVVELVRQVAPGDDLPSMPVLDLFRSLGRKAVPELLGLLKSDTGVGAKIIAADALGHIGDLSAVPQLLELYEHPSLNVRMTVMESLGRLADPRAMPAVLLCMTDSAWEVRAQAAAAAGKIGAREAIPLLQQLLADEHWWVRYYAAESLFASGPMGREALREAAGGDQPTAAEMAAGLLQEKGLAA
jgi:hypothetical protein